MSKLFTCFCIITCPFFSVIHTADICRLLPLHCTGEHTQANAYPSGYVSHTEKAACQCGGSAQHCQVAKRETRISVLITELTTDKLATNELAITQSKLATNLETDGVVCVVFIILIQLL